MQPFIGNRDVSLWAKYSRPRHNTTLRQKKKKEKKKKARCSICCCIIIVYTIFWGWWGRGLTLIQCVLKSRPDTERTIQIWSCPHVWFHVQDRFSSHVGQTMPVADPIKSQCLQVLHLSVLLFHNIHIVNIKDTMNVHLFERSDSIDNTTTLLLEKRMKTIFC